MTIANFRPEIQALRAVSVLLVVVFHLWPERIPGGYVGVDVFFVISGYLITSHLLREVDRTGTIKLSQFYARRIRRLLPAALLVLAVTVITVLAFVPRSSWQLFAQEIGASALYFVNWVLAFNSVDYFAADNAASPVQHYWSLSVEEQFYLVWPLIILVTVLLTRATSAIVRRRAIIAALTVVFIGCFIYSVIATNASQEFAYFATPAHGWEFAAGGLLSMFLPRFGTRAEPARAVVSWVGFAAVIASAFVFDADSLFPGYIALLPVIGAIFVMGAGTQNQIWSPTALISWRPVQFIGDVSYSLYLWHWMPIVILPYVIGRDLGFPAKLGILAASILLAWLTKRFVEDPVRSAPRLRRRRVTYALAAVASLLLLVGTAVPYSIVEAKKVAAAEYLQTHGPTVPDEPAECFGAAAMVDGDMCPESHILNPELGPEFATDDSQTSALRLKSEDDPFFAYDCKQIEGTEVNRCDIGSDDPDETIIVVGDSHANHLIRPTLALAKEHNWRVVRLTHTSCRPTVQSFYETNIPKETTGRCQQWKSDMLDYVASLPATDIIVTSGATQGYYLQDNPPKAEDVASGFAAVWNEWLASGHSVLAVSDVPTVIGDTIPECVEKAHTTIDPCARPRATAIAPDPILIAADRIDSANFRSMSLYDFFCDETTCHSVVGGLITNKDTNHMTGTFSETLAPYIFANLEPLL